MELRELVVKLIIQDMKNHQLLKGLENLGFTNGDGEHTTNIVEIVARLMSIPKGSVSDPWVDTYMDFIFQSAKCDITPLGENLRTLAEASHDMLILCAKREKWKAESTLFNLQVTANGLFNPHSSGYGMLLALYVGGLSEDTQHVAEEIDSKKKPEKVRSLAVKEALNLIKQLQRFTEDLMQLSIEQLQHKYHLK